MASAHTIVRASIAAVLFAFLATACSSGTDGQGGDATVIPAGGDSGAPGDTDAGGALGEDVGETPDAGAGLDASGADTSIQPDADEIPDAEAGDDVGDADIGAADAGPSPDVGVVEDGGSEDAGAEDGGAAPGTKTAGQSCTDHAECVSGAQCVAGEYTQAHCNPGCATDADCNAVAQGAKGTCADVGGASFKICIWWCFGGGVCPGDLECDGAACR